MASYPPTPPPNPRAQRRAAREQARLQRLQLRAFQPSSMVGPILLVGIGILALLVEVGHLSSPHLLDLLGHWWPLLLVAAGIIRLVEWFADQQRRQRAVALGQPFVPRSLGGGVILLLLTLTFGGFLISMARHNGPQIFGRNFTLNQDDWDQFVGDKHETDVSLQHACPDGSALTVNSPHGDITVTGTSTDGQLHVSAHTTVYTRSDADATRRTEELTPIIQDEGSQLVVNVPSGEGARVDLTLSLPPATTLMLHGNQGDVTVHGLEAPVTIIANHGGVEANDINGPLSVHINKNDSSFSAHNDRGPVSLEGRAMDLTLSDMSGPINLNGEFFGTVHLERAGGPLRLHTGRVDLELGEVVGNLELSESADLSGSGIVGPVVLNTRNRNISMERVSGKISITNRNGAVTLSVAPPLENITVQNRTGEVNVTLPTNSGFSVDASTRDADLTNDFGLTPTEDNDVTHLTGTVGGGGPLIHLETSQADLSILKGNLTPLPPLPPLPSSATPPSAPAAPSVPHSGRSSKSSSAPSKHAEVNF